MKHIKLFENFGMSNYKAIGVFNETEMAIGVFPGDEAELIYSRMRRAIPQNSDYASVEIVDLPGNHDLVVVPMGGRGISTSNAAELSDYNLQDVGEIVELGQRYDYSDPDQMIFKADRNLGEFVVLDSSGRTRLVTVGEMENRIA
jgi:hypothetical protein